MKLKKLAYTILATSLMALFAGPSQATMMLTLNDGAGHTATIVDGGAGDLNGAAAGIIWMGSLGSWLGNVTWGGVFGSSNSPGDSVASLDLSGVLTSRRSGTVTVTLTDTFTSPTGSGLGATTQLGGPTSGNVSFNTLLNGGSLFTGTNSAVLPDITGGFSLTQIATITNQGRGTSVFDIHTTVASVPEPATLGLLGLGLIGLGFIRRNRKT